MGRGSWRQGVASALIALAVCVACASVVVQYSANALLDSERFASRSAAALKEPEMQSFLGSKIADGAIARNPDLVALRPLVESAASSVVGSSPFRSLYFAAVRDLHRAVIERDEDAIVLVIADVGTVLRAAVASLDPAAAAKVPVTADARVVNDEISAQVGDAVRALDDARGAARILLLLALVTILGAAWLAPDRRRAAFAGGVALAGASLVLLLGLALARNAVLAEIGDPAARDAAKALWNSLIGDLRIVLLLLAVSGVIITAAARSLLHAVSLERPLRQAWDLITTTPERTPARIARALALLAAGILVLVEPGTLFEVAAVVGGIVLVSVGVNELIRVTAAPRRAGASQPDSETFLPLRGLVLVGVIVVALLVFAGALTEREGGVKAAAPPLNGCNGHRELCDRPFDAVALAGTHNAMSAVTNPGWLFAQQDRGMDAQLADGIRALLIDTHYGRPSGGAVRTELTASEADLAKLEKELGTEAVEAALRIRRRIEGEPTGPRGVYLCHALCELGALPIATALGQIRDFLAANPQEVLLVVVEDAVAPKDFVTAVREAGLERWAYEGPVAPPWPTLRSMIEQDRRLVVFAEKQRGGAPWLRPAFDSIQETPFTFRRTSQLTDPDELAASCRPNRGEKDASLFQINHWIDTSPAPRPSNASTVNAHDPLLRRARTCQEQRGLLPNVLAVDFYRRGDVFDVVDELNGVARRRQRAQSGAGTP